MAFLHCTNGSGGSVETITGSVTSTTGGDFTVTSTQGKAPKRVQVWLTDGARAFTVWNADSKPTHYLFSNYNDGAAWYAVGTAYAYTCSIKSVGSTSITIGYPSVATYGNNRPYSYAVEFE